MLPRPDDPTIELEHARRLIEQSCPTLVPVRLQHLGRGWDHEVFLVNDAWVFRFPRNGSAASALEIEGMALPRLALELPLPIPAPVWRGTADGWPFVGSRFIPGRTICDAELSRDQRGALAPALGHFVKALHAATVEKLPHDPLGRFDVARRGPITHERLSTWRRDGSLPETAADKLLRLWTDPPSILPDDPLVVVHADLHARNILVGEHGELTGIIDWVDVHEGHRALDLVVAFEVVPPDARGEFFAAYGSVSDVTLRWARWRAINHMTAGWAGAIERNDTVFARSCRAALIEIAEG